MNDDIMTSANDAFEQNVDDNNYTGKVCPFCKTEIKSEDEVKVCPACGIAHHESCWTENNGCTTFGCSEQHYEPKNEVQADVCPSCGEPFAEGQEFCAKCGAKRTEIKKNICSKCGTELEEGQQFCPKCGQKADLQLNEDVNSAISEFNATVDKKRKNKKPLIIGLIMAIVAIGAIVAIFISGIFTTKDFNDMFSDISGYNWCEIGSDGTWMKIDTNPYDIDDEFLSTAYIAIETINTELGFSSSVIEEMGETRALDGRQTATVDGYEVSWSYHPDNGLEVMYKIIK